MTTPIYTPTEQSSRETFLALMWALSYPGQVRALPTADPVGTRYSASADTHFLLIGDALLDLETSFYTPDAALTDALGRTGARSLPPESAAYHVYPTCDDAALDGIGRAHVGTMLRPDESATLIIGCAFASGGVFRWRGPGVRGEAIVRLGGVPARFRTLRNRALRYPLGWDVYFVDGSRVIGLPRTTVVEEM